MGVEVLLAPAELEEGGAADDLATNQDVLAIALAVEVDIGSWMLGVGFASLLNHPHQVLVVAIDEDGAFVADEEVVQLALRLAHTLERAEALQVGASYIRDESTGRLSSLH